MLFMGASRDDHTDRKDQWEGWDMEDNGTEEDAVSDGRCVHAPRSGRMDVYMFAVRLVL